MKKLFSVVASVVAALFVLTSCGDKPSAVAEQSMKCLQEKDYKGYVDLIYFSEEDQKAADFEEKKAQYASLVEKTLKEQAEKGIKEYEVVSEEANDSTAVVRMAVTSTAGEVDTTDVKLRKDHTGAWKLENNK